MFLDIGKTFITFKKQLLAQTYTKISQYKLDYLLFKVLNTKCGVSAFSISPSFGARTNNIIQIDRPFWL
jgi:hypothetical protein